ncbi:hypothetical protein [Methylobacterium radiotolerans]|uniref:hypothetical protein n=1 Tax=Methylobacterium radiotolerans TaxID=31998 RepID=UPI000975874E|nr:MULTISPECIES: hypothetical protein [Methylobacterium]MDE3749509.1 hypothetical protein [Methylobacterium radiotolerans]ONF48362.1 hypothetical protein RSM1_14425 [Methylobacterium radiotolerans]PVY94249.1 hypothetical protein C7388_1293 [Methylobacterium organophilum]
MAEDNTLTKALVDVRARRAALQSDYDRIAAELTKLRAAEAALTSIVEGIPLDASGLHAPEGPRVAAADRAAPASGGGRRGARGPRANSAKGRLKALLGSAGPQGLSHAQIAERLPDVAPNTLNTYLSMLVTGGEAIRNGDFFTAAAAPDGAEDGEAGVEADPDADEEVRHDAAAE